MWNQDSKDTTTEYKDFYHWPFPEEDDNNLPGFEFFGAVLAMITLSGIGYFIKRRVLKRD